MAEVSLELKEIKKSFTEGEAVLDNISLEISKGEFITLLGSSGCGKTTTLRIIAGLEQPDAGSVWLDGREVTGLEPNQRDVNTVFQNYALFPHMNVAENISYGLKLKKVPKSEIRKKVSQMLELVQLEGYEKRIDKINATLKEYGIGSVEECKEICLANGIDCDDIVRSTQPICFENAVWAYTVGAAIAIKSGAKKAYQAAEKIGVGVPTMQDITKELMRPGRDPRDELPPPMLRTDVMDMKDLKPGMELKGTVRNVIDFGAFVDIGVHQDGLVHISEMTERFIKHPLEAVSVGDIVDVRVIGVDMKKKRISLSMKGLNK